MGVLGYLSKNVSEPDFNAWITECGRINPSLLRVLIRVDESGGFGSESGGYGSHLQINLMEELAPAHDKQQRRWLIARFLSNFWAWYNVEL